MAARWRAVTTAWHYHEDVGIGIPAGLTAGKGAVADGFSVGVQDHLLRGELLHHPLSKRLQCLIMAS
jgi:hypothetical protein